METGHGEPQNLHLTSPSIETHNDDFIAGPRVLKVSKNKY